MLNPTLVEHWRARQTLKPSIFIDQYLKRRVIGRWVAILRMRATSDIDKK